MSGNIFSIINVKNIKCSYCLSSFSYKGSLTGNLSKHLKRKPIIQYEARKSRRIEIEQNVDEPEPREQNSSQPNIPNMQGKFFTSTNVSTITKSRPLQTTVDLYLSKPLTMTNQKTIDEQLCIMISKEFQPFSLVANVEFKLFVKLLNLGYKLPSRKTISKSILQLYGKIKLI